MCGFRRRQTITELGKKWWGSEKRSPFRNMAPQRKPPDTTILDTFATSKRIFQKSDMTTPFYFLYLLWGPLGHHARSVKSSAKSLHFGQPCPPAAQTPQSLCSCAASIPKKSASGFSSLHHLHFATFLVDSLNTLASTDDAPKKQTSQVRTCRDCAEVEILTGTKMISTMRRIFYMQNLKPS